MRIRDAECKWTINRPRPASTNGISPVTPVVLVYAACISGASRHKSNVRCDSRCAVQLRLEFRYLLSCLFLILFFLFMFFLSLIKVACLTIFIRWNRHMENFSLPSFGNKGKAVYATLVCIVGHCVAQLDHGEKYSIRFTGSKYRSGE